MPTLDWETAKRLARMLGSIGHKDELVEATAADLTAWCKGAIVDNRVITPEEQAVELVQAARIKWIDGWIRTGGTAAFRLLFEDLYGHDQPARIGTPVLTHDEALKRRLVEAPCEWCSERGWLGEPPHVEFCECRVGRHMKDYLGLIWLERKNAPPVESNRPERHPNRISLAEAEEQLREAKRQENRRRLLELQDLEAKGEL